MKLNQEFLARCKRNNPYDETKIPANSYTGLTFKQEIREIFNQNYFSGFNNFLKSVGNGKEINSRIAELQKINLEGYKSLYAKYYDFGPGERILYYLIDEAVLAGGKSGGDLNVGGEVYEIKAGEIKQGGKYVGGFFTGRAADVGKIISDLSELTKSPRSSEIAKSYIDRARLEDKKSFEAIRKNYSEFIYKNYFSKYNMIFFDVKTQKVLTIKEVKPRDIDIETVTQNAIKPLIKL